MAASPPADRVRLTFGAPGKTLFKWLTDARIRIHSSPDLADPVPDWVVLPCSQDLSCLEQARDLPWAAWLKAKGDRARILFDASGEARPHHPPTTQALHGLLQAIGAPAGAGVYITQDRTYRDAYLGHYGAGDGRAPLRVLTYDYYIRRLFAQFDGAGEDAFEARLAAYRARPQSRGRRFVSLNLTPRPAKVLFLLRLLRDGLWDAGHISFGGFQILQYTRRGDALPLFEAQMRKLPGFRDLAEELLPWMPALDALGEVLFGDIPRADGGREILNLPIGDQPLAQYADAWFTVATESDMLDRPARITEKAFKALLNFHPQIVLGNPGSLAALKDLGFVTFDGVFDESYDEEPDPRARFEMVYRETARLCALDEAELRRLDQGISDRLEHNCRWGMTGLPAVFRDRIDIALIDAILGPAG